MSYIIIVGSPVVDGGRRGLLLDKFGIDGIVVDTIVTIEILLKGILSTY